MQWGQVRSRSQSVEAESSLVEVWQVEVMSEISPN